MHLNHASLLRNATGGRAARLRVCDQLDFTYQDSGILPSLMDGNLDAPDGIPAGGARAHDYHRCGAMQLAARSGVAS